MVEALWGIIKVHHITYCEDKLSLNIGTCLQNSVHLTVILQADRNLHMFFSFAWMVPNQSI